MDMYIQRTRGGGGGAGGMLLAGGTGISMPFPASTSCRLVVDPLWKKKRKKEKKRDL